MRWSKLKQRVEQNFADSVRGRVELHQTRYREAHDQEGELWITFDGEQIHSAGSFTAQKAVAETSSEYENSGMSIRESSVRAHRELEQLGVVEAGRLVALLKSYLNQSIDQVMKSPNPIIRGLGLLDRRFGVRRLERFDSASEHDFVVRMFKIRCDAEGLSRKQTIGTDVSSSRI